MFEQGLGSERDWSTADSERDLQKAVSQRLLEIAQESGIEDIIKNAVYVYDAKVDDDEVETVKAVHIYYCPVFIDGTQYSARMVVKEYYQGSQVINELHLYNVMLKKRHQTNTLSQDGTPHMRSDASIHYKISDLIHNTQKLDQINFSKIAVDTKGNRYYDHNLTAIEKGKLIDIANNEQSAVASGFGTTPDTKSTTNSQRKCRELLSILQTNASKIVDANGEPVPVYHGTIRKGLRKFNSFDTAKPAWFAYHKDYAEIYNRTSSLFKFSDLYSVFLNIREPLIIPSVNYSFLDEKEREIIKSHFEQTRIPFNEVQAIIDEIRPAELWWDGNDAREWGYDTKSRLSDDSLSSWRLTIYKSPSQEGDLGGGNITQNDTKSRQSDDSLSSWRLTIYKSPSQEGDLGGWVT